MAIRVGKIGSNPDTDVVDHICGTISVCPSYESQKMASIQAFESLKVSLTLIQRLFRFVSIDS